MLAASLLAACAPGPFRYVDVVQSFPDMNSYGAAMDAVRHWQLERAAARQFWGFAYAGALVSLLLPSSVPSLIVLIAVSAVAACIATALAHHLWGGWIAAGMAAVGWPWIQRVAFGGAEPLFLALVLAALAAARREWWVRAALAAALATTVRPVGVFALAAVLAVAVRRHPRSALAGAGVSLLVLVLYCVPVAIGTGDPLANVHWYMPQMTNGLPVGIPFVGLWRGTRTNQVSVLRNIEMLTAVGVVLAPVAVWVLSARCRVAAARYPAETIFALAYSGFLVTLNCPPCAWFFPRFAIISLPFALLTVRRWLPRDDRVLAGAAVISALIAAATQINMRDPGTSLLHLFVHL